MPMTSLLPDLWSRDDSVNNSFRNLQKEIDRVFHNFTSSDIMSSSAPDWRSNSNLNLLPRIDVSETDKEISIEVELPGVERKDVDITVVDQLLTIKGSKNTEQETKEKNYHLIERSRGSFERTIPLGFEVDSNQVDAKFHNGVLSLTVTKPPELESKVKKIEVKTTEPA